MELNYEIHGEGGYPLIILHGLFASLQNWRTVARRFSECYQVFTVDQRNHGGSPHSDVFNYQVMAEDVKEFMDSRGMASAYVLGHSMGGKTAMQLALTHPERVDKLVVVDIAPRAYPPHHDQILTALRAVNPGGYRLRRDVDDALAAYIPGKTVRQFLLTNLVRDGDGAFKWQLNVEGIDRHYEEITREIDAERPYQKPVLFIDGETSEYIQPGDEESIKRLFPYSRIVTVPGVGHWVHAEARARFFRAVATFLGM